MYSVEFTNHGTKSKTTTDAPTERQAKVIMTKSLAGATVHWDTFTNDDPKPFVLMSPKKSKKSDPEPTPDVHL